MSLNSVIMMGRMVADPELRATQSGINVCTFRIAVDRDVATKENGQKTDFIDCVAWRKTGEFVSRYFTKGKPILVQGRLQIRPYEDKAGNKRTAAEILCESINFCGGDKFDRNTAVVQPGVPTEGVAPTMNPFEGDDDVPWEDHDLK